MKKILFVLLSTFMIVQLNAQGVKETYIPNQVLLKEFKENLSACFKDASCDLSTKRLHFTVPEAEKMNAQLMKNNYPDADKNAPATIVNMSTQLMNRLQSLKKDNATVEFGNYNCRYGATKDMKLIEMLLIFKKDDMVIENLRVILVEREKGYLMIKITE